MMDRNFYSNNLKISEVFKQLDEGVLEIGNGSFEIFDFENSIKIVAKNTKNQIEEASFNKPIKIIELIGFLVKKLSKNHVTNSIIGPFEIDDSLKKIYYLGEKLLLTNKEYELLHYFLKSFPKKIDKAELLEKIWGYSTEIETKTLYAHFHKLRKKISKDLFKLEDNYYFLDI